MPDALYSLVWYPATRSFEATRFAERALPGRDAVLLHRRHAPNLAMGAAYVEVGAALLPAHMQPATGDGVRLLWLPMLPWRCLLAAREGGVVRVTDRPDPARDRHLSDALIHLETECAWAFEEAFSGEPNEADIACRLAAAHERAVDVISRFAVHASPPRLWNLGGDA